AKGIADLIQLVEEGKISYSIASQKIFPLLINNPEKSPFQIAEDNNLLQESDDDNISEFVSQAIAKYPDKVIEYKNGKKGLIGLFMGEVMKLSKGKADPQKASIQVEKMLNE
ncbi:MAG TPA: Asp-tRNA(Asn)/Glu-tRNA(Gln) amidotransferase GatCAB subunit B, partial [Flavobacteriales bacterium]|nr:Asp-tRNA(Asn)/Glu-tRNA(Gln) amidotransferase GatCAB subunit B [Flavobacteriales bacterium]